MFKFLKLILSWHDWHDPEPGPPAETGDWNTAFWFIVIFCFVLYGLGQSDKNK